ncbi:ATP-dependent RNA helicase p62 isoform X2 [Bemisia tabaci]|uniref:ATP-dependent RNA helicase p62 isoform X2 n=1 Tax=Bemisia tabaci TaxID=7038 RepID=UPI003B27CE32
MGQNLKKKSRKHKQLGGVLKRAKSPKKKTKYIPGQFLKDVNWSSVNLFNIQKDFFKPSNSTKARSAGEVDTFLKLNNITINRNAPILGLEFEEAIIDGRVIASLRKLGYEKPTPIQAVGWPVALSGSNLVGIAQTGSGKTLGYLLPALTHIANQKPSEAGDGPIVLILAPTRELVQQIQNVANQFDVKALAVFGGKKKDVQIKFLQECPQLVVATPGRLLDLLQMEATNLKRTSFVVIDEADRMLDMGFEYQLRKLLNQVRPDRQLVMWSATWPQSVQKLASDFLGDYVQIHVGNKDLAANHNIKQIVEVCHEFEKQDKIVDLLKKLEISEGLKTFIFSNTKRQVDFICRLLKKHEFKVGAIHGDKSQSKRNSILKEFSDGFIEVLVATDVAARGLDINDVKHVINYDFPLNTEDYIHRIGRTARYQKQGTAFTFFTPKERSQAGALIKILEEAKQTVRPELKSLSKNAEKIKRLRNGCDRFWK